MYQHIQPAIAHICYSVYDATSGTLLHIDSCPLSHWHNQPAMRLPYIHVDIHAIEPAGDAKARQRSELASHAATPPYNGTLRIACDQDGRTYANQSETATTYGIDQGRLSRHLRGAPGYATVRGLTFRYVPAPSSAPAWAPDMLARLPIP